MKPHLWTPDEVADYWHVDLSEVYKLIKSNQIRYIPVGANFRIPYEQVLYGQTIIPQELIKSPLPPGITEPDSGFVYLFSWKHYFKIGRAQDVDIRLAQFECLPEPLGIVCLHRVKARNAAKSERSLHVKYKEYQVRGEWFILSSDDVEWFCSLKDGDLDERT